MPEVRTLAIPWRFRNGLDEILLVNRSQEPFNRTWCLPFGELAEGEGMKNAVSRIVQEQTELGFEGRFFRVFDEILPDHGIHNVIVCFEGNVANQEPHLGQGASAVEWTPIRNAFERNLGFSHREVLKAYGATAKRILIKDAQMMLGVNDEAMTSWIERGILQSLADDNGNQVLDEREFSRFAHTQEARGAYLDNFGFSVKRREDDVAEGLNARFLREISATIARYRERIAKLQEIHHSRNATLNVFMEETALVAAYVIFSKVIRLLNMGCDCLERRHWDSLLLLRPLDEAMDLALYFLIAENTEKGRRHLSQWFRENASPQHQICRHEISEFMRANENDNRQQILQEISRLYRHKSQFVHVTYRDIMETFRAKLGPDVVYLEGCEYGSCTYPRKIHQITEFFESQIWVAERRFFECFYERLHLTPREKDYLLSHPEPLRKAIPSNLEVHTEQSQSEHNDGIPTDQLTMAEVIRQFRSR